MDNKSRVVANSVHLRNCSELKSDVKQLYQSRVFRPKRSEGSVFGNDPLLQNYTQFSVSRFSELTLRHFFFRRLWVVLSRQSHLESEKLSTQLEVFRDTVQVPFHYYTPHLTNVSVILKKRIT